MEVEGGGLILTAEQMQQWFATYPDEYNEYVDAGLLDPDSGELLDIPEWMNNGNPDDGPFDFNLNPSHGTSGF